MQVYVLIESNIYQDGSEDSRTIGIFDSKKQADEACEKMERSIMYDSYSFKKFYVREKHLNQVNADVDIPKEGLVVLKLQYMYIGSMTDMKEEKADPNHHNINFDWFLLDKATTPPVEKISSKGATTCLSVIAGESSKDFRQRRVARFHEMWEEVNKKRKESGLVTLPFEMY